MKQSVLHGNSKVADTAVPTTRIPFLDPVRNDQFDLRSRPESPLVDELRCPGCLALGGGGKLEDRFVFGKGLFSDKSARQIQLTAWPIVILTKGPDMVERHLHLFDTQSLPERGHHPVKRSCRSPVVNHR